VNRRLYSAATRAVLAAGGTGFTSALSSVDQEANRSGEALIRVDAGESSAAVELAPADLGFERNGGGRPVPNDGVSHRVL
jgi:hypothetical protein